MSHDHRRISAVVDGEAGIDERDDVLAHVMGCDDCRSFYQHERAAKLALTTGAGAGTTPATLVAALLALGPGSATSPRASAPVRSRTVATAPHGHPSRPHELPGQHRRRLRRAAKGLSFSALGAGLLCAIAFVLGADAPPRVTTVDLASLGVEHAGVVDATAHVGVPASIGARSARAVPAGFAVTAPASRPAATSDRLDTAASRGSGITVSTYRNGRHVVSVFQVDGRFDPTALSGFSARPLDGARVFRRLGKPSYQVWTCHDVTYAVVGDSTTAMDQVSRQLPHICPARSGWSRVGHGMHRAAGWLNPIS